MYDEIFARHSRVAFQFSGGKDSTAALLLLRPYWDKMTVYWLDSGDAFPETRKVIADVLNLGVPQFVRVPGQVHEVIAEFGPPSDLVPFGSSERAHSLSVGTGPMIQDRAMCCARSKFVPMHQRMLDDGITLIVRGQKACDKFKGPFMDGDIAQGIELFYPVQEWTDEQVMSYLQVQLPSAIAPYAHMDKSGDCMRCTAWLGDKRGAYLKAHHPIAFEDYRRRLRTIAAECAPVVEVFFNSVVQACGDQEQKVD